MRAFSVLLVAATSLLVASDAAVATNSAQSTLSKMASPDAVQATRADEAVNSQRLLRGYKVVYDDGDEDVDNFDAAEEERGKPPFAADRLNKALNNNSKLGKLLKQWDDNNYSLQHVATNIGVNLNGPLDQKYMSLATAFSAYKRGWRPQ